MKRMIKSNNSLHNRYLVSEVLSTSFPGMIAFSLIDAENEEDLLNKRDIALEYIYPHKQVLCLWEGDADNILEQLEEHYHKDIRPSDVRDILLNDQCSGVITKLDGVLVMIAGQFDRRPVV